MMQDNPKLTELVALFLDWNSKINLSAIRDEAGVWEKHIADSLLLNQVIDLENISGRVLDIGTGGGFPMLPLACVYPHLEFTGVDSVGKKLKAVQSMADKLELKVQTIHDRIEVLGQDKQHREQYNLVLARALAPWPVLLEYALPFVKMDGYFVAYQGPGIVEELKIHKNLERKLGANIEKVVTLKLGEAERNFVVLKKGKATPKHYPRAVGIPRQKPLKI